MLGSLKSFLWSAPQLTRASVLLFSVQQLQRLTAWWQEACLSLSWVPSGLAIGGRRSGRWLDGCNILCLLILQVAFLVYNMNWIFLIFCEDTEKLQTYLGWILSETANPIPDFRVAVLSLFDPSMSLTERRLCKSHSLMCSAGHITDSDHVFPELNDLSECSSSYFDLRSNATSVEKSSLATLPGQRPPVTLNFITQLYISS